jgi:hypothetical protein
LGVSSWTISVGINARISFVSEMTVMWSGWIGVFVASETARRMMSACQTTCSVFACEVGTASTTS